MYNIELLDRVCDRLSKELEDQIRKIDKLPQMTPQDLEIVDTILHGIKSLETVKAMKESGYSSGYSGYKMTYSSRYPDYSGRSRDSMGRYSGHDDRGELMERLDEMMRNARSDEEARAIQDAMNSLSRVR